MSIAKNFAPLMLGLLAAATAAHADVLPPGPPPPSIEIGKTYEGRVRVTDAPDLSGGGTQQDFRIQLNAGDTIKIEGQSQDFDIAVAVYDAQERLDLDDDGGEDTNARMIVRANTSGPHTVRVMNPWVDRMGEGRYTLAITRATAEEARELERDDGDGCGCGHHHHDD